MGGAAVTPITAERDKLAEERNVCNKRAQGVECGQHSKESYTNLSCETMEEEWGNPMAKARLVCGPWLPD